MRKTANGPLCLAWASQHTPKSKPIVTGKTILSFLPALGFKMEFKYEIWRDVKAPTVEGYVGYRDLSITDNHLFLALSLLSLGDEEFAAGALASVYVGWPMESELVQNFFALVKCGHEGPLKVCKEQLHSRKAKQIFLNWQTLELPRKPQNCYDNGLEWPHNKKMLMTLSPPSYSNRNFWVNV